MQSFAGIAQLIPNLYLLIVGGGKKQFEEEVQNLIAQLEIGNRVRSIGMSAYQDIPSDLAMGDIFVTTSVSETFGMSTVEAMGVGLPIMGIHSTGTSDIVEDGKTGLLSTENLAAFTAKRPIFVYIRTCEGKWGARRVKLPNNTILSAQ